MSAAPLLDVQAAPPQPADLPAPEIANKESKPSEPFDTMLAEVESDDAVAPPLPKEKSEDQNFACALGLVSICPPPQPIEPAKVEAEVEAKTESKIGGEKLSAPIVKMEEDALQPIEEPPPETQPLAKPLAELVRPRPAAKPVKKPESRGVELDPKLFEPVKDGAILLPPKPMMTAASAPDAHAGTVVAQLEKQMKNVEKTAEIAPSIEQKMPTRDFSRRSLTEAARLEPLSFISNSEFTAKMNFDGAHTPEVAPSKSLDAAHLIESIRTEVTSFRHRADATMSVVLRPATGGELTVSLSVGHDGAIHAQARCERGDFQSLNAQWPQLQQSLGAAGIRLADLSNTGQSHQQAFNGNGGGPQTSGREQNSQQSRREPNGPSFEEELAGNAPRSAGAKSGFQTARPASSRRWQSWA